MWQWGKRRFRLVMWLYFFCSVGSYHLNRTSSACASCGALSWEVCSPAETDVLVKTTLCTSEYCLYVLTLPKVNFRQTDCWTLRTHELSDESVWISDPSVFNIVSSSLIQGILLSLSLDRLLAWLSYVNFFYLLGWFCQTFIKDSLWPSWSILVHLHTV